MPVSGSTTTFVNVLVRVHSPRAGSALHNVGQR